MTEATQQETKTNQQGLDISPMLNDVNRVLHMHLTNLLNPVLSERQNVREILKNMPFVRNLVQKNELLKRTNSGLNMDISTMKSYYEEILKEKESVIQEMVLKLEQLEKGTVRLEVKEKNDENKEEFNPEMSYSENTKITENSLTLASNDNLGRFMSLMSDEDSNEEDTDEEYEYEEDSDEENKKDDEEDDEEDNEEDNEEDDDDEDNEEYDEENKKDDEENKNEEEDKINPFPFDSTAGINFAHGINSTNVNKAPYVWSTLCKYAPQNIREAYPELDWSITDRYKKEVANDVKDHVEITSAGTIESSDDESGLFKYTEPTDTENINFHSTILKAQEAEEYATIDTDSEEEEAMEVEDVEIDGISYLTTGTVNGDIYKLDSEGEILEDENGDWVKVGYFKDGNSFFI